MNANGRRGREMKMWRGADAKIVNGDPALPGLSLLLDAQALLRRIRLLPQLERTRALAIEYLRYKPATSCVAGLLLTDADGACRRYYAKALTPERFARVRRRAPQSASLLPDAAVIVALAADDSDLPGLSLLYHPGELGRQMAAWLPEIDPSVPLGWRLLRYKPGRRAVAQIACRGQALAVLRWASAQEYGRIVQGNAIGAALGHIALVGADAQRRLLATRWLEGESLCPEQRGDCPLGEMRLAGEKLAEVHDSDFSLPLRRRGSDDVEALWRVRNTLMAVAPHSVPRFIRLAARIARRLMRLTTPPTLIHGDFSADQLIRLRGDGALRIVDWDRAAYGNPLADIATFQARLELQVIERTVSREQADGAVAALLAGYLPRRALPLGDLGGYVAWAALCLAAEPFRKRAARWPAQLDALLTAAERLLDAPPSGAAVAASDGVAALRDSQRVADAVLAASGAPAGSRLTHSEIVRHKPGKRALVHYRISPPAQAAPWELLGKYGEKGVDERAFRCQLTLWRNGFDNRADVAVPEPLALVPSFNLWLQRKVAARPMADFLFPDAENLRQLGERVGAALARLQQNRALRREIAARRWGIEDELAILRRRLADVAACHPRWRDRLDPLLHAAEKRAIALINERDVCLHRDFYFDQVLVPDDAPGRLVLVDFDLCRLGPAALDAGNYIAHVQEFALRCHGDSAALAPHEQGFCDAFLAHSPGVALDAVQGFTHLSLLRHISLSTQFAERVHTTETLIALCEKALHRWSGL
ncbi:aminoglycoside phosphotransferase [Brenneria sp. EniD312]|nr:aminoglycoside phosphotransferase [Brenneria sp. EniD312]